MGKMLLGFAAIAAVSVACPALAESQNGGGHHGHHPGFGDFQSGGHDRNGDRRDRRDRRDDDIGVWVNSGEWARYNNTNFQSDSFNGWWHDRPDRAYPAWVRNNQDCARKWYAGNTLRC